MKQLSLNFSKFFEEQKYSKQQKCQLCKKAIADYVHWVSDYKYACGVCKECLPKSRARFPNHPGYLTYTGTTEIVDED